MAKFKIGVLAALALGLAWSARAQSSAAKDDSSNQSSTANPGGQNQVAPSDSTSSTNEAAPVADDARKGSGMRDAAGAAPGAAPRTQPASPEQQKRVSPENLPAAPESAEPRSRGLWLGLGIGAFIVVVFLLYRGVRSESYPDRR
jgi:hypothetical protein